MAFTRRYCETVTGYSPYRIDENDRMLFFSEFIRNSFIPDNLKALIKETENGRAYPALTDIIYELSNICRDDRSNVRYADLYRAFDNSRTQYMQTDVDPFRTPGDTVITAPPLVSPTVGGNNSAARTVRGDGYDIMTDYDDVRGTRQAPGTRQTPGGYGGYPPAGQGDHINYPPKRPKKKNNLTPILIVSGIFIIVVIAVVLSILNGKSISADRPDIGDIYPAGETCTALCADTNDGEEAHTGVGFDYAAYDNY